MKTYDALVVGARVAGASTALLLARAGLRVAVVERSRLGSDTLSTHGLMRAGVLQLSRWNLLGEVIAAGTPAITGTSFHYPDGTGTHVSIRSRAGVAALYAPRRYLLDQILVAAAAEAGADVLPETTVTALRRNEDGRVSGVRATQRDGRTLELAATTTIGADGFRSTVADLVQAPIVLRGRHASSVLYRYFAGVPTRNYEWAYGHRAAAGVIPTNDELACVFVSATSERLRAMRRVGGERVFSTLLTEVAPEFVDCLATAVEASRLHGWSGSPGYMRQSWGPGWALVGDAGYFKDPITTHGMTDAMRDAELLADAILASTSGAMPESVALALYQATRSRLSGPLFEVTDAVAGYDWDAHQIQHMLRQVSSAMSDEVDHLQSLPARLDPHDGRAISSADSALSSRLG